MRLRPAEHLRADLPFFLIQHVKAEIELPEGGAARGKLIEIVAEFLRGRLNGLLRAGGFHRVAIDWVVIIQMRQRELKLARIYKIKIPVVAVCHHPVNIRILLGAAL